MRQCELIKHQKLLEAAAAKQDEELLQKLREKDHVAIEVIYHNSCFLKYIQTRPEALALKMELALGSDDAAIHRLTQLDLVD